MCAPRVNFVSGLHGRADLARASRALCESQSFDSRFTEVDHLCGGGGTVFSQGAAPFAACQFQRWYPFIRLSKSSIGLSIQAWVTKSLCLASVVARNVTLPWRRVPCSDVLNATSRPARMC